MIDVRQIIDALYKNAASDSKSDPTADAQAGAAAAAKPSWAPPVPDFRKFNKDEEDDSGQDLQQQLDKRDKEIEQLKRDKRIVEQNLEFEQIKSRQAEALNTIEQRERQSLEKLRQEKEKLDQNKVMAEAEEIKHQSKLQQQESDSQLKVQQDKNKALMDLHNQGMKMQMQQAEEARNQADKYKEEARKQIEKERQDVYSSYDKEKQQMQAQMDKQRQELQKQHSGMSPALSSVMQGAIKQLSQFNKPKPFKLPKPGAAPIDMQLINPRAHQEEAQQQHQPETDPLQTQRDIPVPGKSPVEKLAAVQPAATAGAAARAGRNTGNSTDHIISPFEGQWLGYPEVFSGILGSVLGPQFNFYRKLSKYKQTRNNDRVFDPTKFIAGYSEHWKDPRWQAINPRGYKEAPGAYSVRTSLSSSNGSLMS